MPVLVRKDNPKLAAIVSTLKTRPPVNFNVALHTHAIGYGVKLHAIKYAGPKVHIAAQAVDFGKIRAFAHSLPSKFPHILHGATVTESKYVNVDARSPYLKNLKL